MTSEKFDQENFQKKLYENWGKTMSEAFALFAKNPIVQGTESGNASQDPQAEYKKLFSVWEETMSEALESWMKTPLFSAAVGQAIDKSSQLKQYFDEGMERNLKNMQLPTKSDIDKILMSIIKIEERINDLIERVEDLKESTV